MNTPYKSISRIFIGPVLFGLSALALAHPALVQSTPGADEALTSAPKEIRLKFNEPIEVSFTHVKVVDSAGKALPVEGTKADPADASTAVVPVSAMPPGSYKASWSAVGRDGHHVKGELHFSVK